MTTNNIEIETLEEERSKKKSTKITASIILGFVFVIAIFILVSSFANVGLNPNFVARPDRIEIYKAGYTETFGTITTEKEKEDVYKEFMTYYNDMFSSSFLSALFNGRLSGYSISEGEPVDNVTILTKGFENDYIRFKYDTPISLTYKDGAEYKKKTNSEKPVTFTDLYFELNKEDMLKTVTFYVIDYDTMDTDGGKVKYYQVSLAANTSDLAENIEKFYNSPRS